MIRAAQTIQLSDTGRQRRANEDSVYARAPVFVVADGMGGARAGEVASRIAVEAFERGLPDSGSPEQRLADRVREANREIHEISRAEHERAGMGTTITAAYLDDGQVAIAHVGDSRAYLFRDGKLQRLTQDHSLVGELVRRGKLTEEQAEEHPQRSIITRALGPEPSVDVDTWTYPVRDGDVLLLCSDGLTSMITEEQITEILTTESDLERAGDRLIGEANAGGGRYNCWWVLSRGVEVSGDSCARGGAFDAPTMVGARAVPTPAAEPPRAAEPAPRRSVALPGRREPVARETVRRSRRRTKLVAALVATLVVICLIVGGGYLATRQLYFVGTNSQGVITIYRGLPYDLPAGIHLYETVYVSGVPASLLPADRRNSILGHDLRSQKDAINLVRDLEQGRLSG